MCQFTFLGEDEFVSERITLPATRGMVEGSFNELGVPRLYRVDRCGIEEDKRDDEREDMVLVG